MADIAQSPCHNPGCPETLYPSLFFILFQHDKEKISSQVIFSDAKAGGVAPSQGLLEWALQGSNLRPADYESAALTN